jgi:ABC-type phosphate transport system permease subunit
LTFSMTSKILLDIVYRFPDNTARSALMGLAAVLFIMEMIILIVTKAIGARLK